MLLLQEVTLSPIECFIRTGNGFPNDPNKMYAFGFRKISFVLVRIRETSDRRKNNFRRLTCVSFI
jgi:hypothetical protein